MSLVPTVNSHQWCSLTVKFDVNRCVVGVSMRRMIDAELGNYINSKIGCFLGKARWKAGLSLENAAQKLNYLSASTLESYESGRTGIPCCEFVRALDTYGGSMQRAQTFMFELQIEIWRRRKKT